MLWGSTQLSASGTEKAWSCAVTEKILWILSFYLRVEGMVLTDIIYN